MKPLLIYDGKCTVCSRQVQNLEGLIGDRFEKESFRTDKFFERHPEISKEACELAIQLLLPTGRIYSGAEAVARVVALRKIFLPAMWLYYVPGLRSLWDAFYRFIAKNRYWISKKIYS